MNELTILDNTHNKVAGYIVDYVQYDIVGVPISGEWTDSSMGILGQLAIIMDTNDLMIYGCIQDQLEE